MLASGSHPSPAPAGRFGRPPFPPGPLLRAPTDLDDDDTRSEQALHVATARVVLADDALLRHDFPRLREPALTAARPELLELEPEGRARALRQITDGWLLENAAFLSQRQTAQEKVNTPIETGGEPIDAWRPPRYGRALVVPLRNPLADGDGAGLLDLKGAGLAPGVKPRPGVHGNGLMYLGEALGDLVLQELIEALFAHAGTEFWTVPVYAVLDLGFDIVDGQGRRWPAGMQVRRAHRRPRGGVELPSRGSKSQRVKLEIEMLLRYYGITSCNSSTAIGVVEKDGQLRTTYGGRPVSGYWPSGDQRRRFLEQLGITGPGTWEGINIQLTRGVRVEPSGAQVVDFGHYEIHERFERPVVSLVRDRPMRWGGAIEPDSPHFSQPAPELRPPFEHWGQLSPAEEQAAGLPDAVSPYRHMRLANRLARAFRRGELTGSEVRDRLSALVTAAIDRWPGL